jgi:ubiquinone/menaquinone biosynthesis C-methylase UbiE
MTSSEYLRIVRKHIPDVDFHQNHYARTLDEVIQDGSRWLDIGAGSRIHNGYGVPAPTTLANRCLEVVGLDFEAEHLKSNPSLSSFVIGGGDAMPFPECRFELITANMVLEHLENPQAVFAEVARTLVPGGKFVFVTPNRNHPLVRAASLILRPQTQRMIAHKFEGRPLEHIFPTYYRANTLRDIRTLAAQSGLVVDSLTVIRNIPFMSKPAFATWIECQFIRASNSPRLRALGADLIGVLSKPSR